jgi:hypothetical protein
MIRIRNSEDSVGIVKEEERNNINLIAGAFLANKLMARLYTKASSLA